MRPPPPPRARDDARPSRRGLDELDLEPRVTCPAGDEGGSLALPRGALLERGIDRIDCDERPGQLDHVRGAHGRSAYGSAAGHAHWRADVHSPLRGPEEPTDSAWPTSASARPARALAQLRGAQSAPADPRRGGRGDRRARVRAHERGGRRAPCRGLAPDLLRALHEQGPGLPRGVRPGRHPAARRCRAANEGESGLRSGWPRASARSSSRSRPLPTLLACASWR